MRVTKGSGRALRNVLVGVVFGVAVHSAGVLMAEPAVSQGQVVSIGILDFHDESGGRSADLPAKLTQELRRRLFIAHPDLLAKMLGQETAADSSRGMTLEEVTGLGRQYGVKYVVRGGLMPASVETAGGQTKVTVRLYAEVASSETGEVRSLRAEGSGIQEGMPRAGVGFESIDFRSAEFAASVEGQALSTCIDQLVEGIHQEVASLSAVVPPPSVATPATEEMPAGEAAGTEPDEQAAQATAEDQDVQQLIADAEATIAAAQAADPALLDRVRLALEELRGVLAAKADQLQRGESSEETDQALDRCREELRAAIAAVADSGSMTSSEPAAGGRGHAQDLLAQANTCAGEALGLIQKIQDLRAMLRGTSEETHLEASDQSFTEASQESVEEVSGVVVEDGQPVEGAQVIDTESGATATTGSDGSYVLRPIPAGTLSHILVRARGQQLAAEAGSARGPTLFISLPGIQTTDWAAPRPCSPRRSRRPRQRLRLTVARFRLHGARDPVAVCYRPTLRPYGASSPSSRCSRG